MTNYRKSNVNKTQIPFWVFLLVQVLFFFAPGMILADALNLPKDNEGWTIFTPSPDSRIVYVSAAGDDTTGVVYSSTDAAIGSDPFRPVGPISPYLTYAAAHAQTRKEYPDWILIKRGDTFEDTIYASMRNGRSVTEPFLVGAYGSTGASPIFKTPDKSAGKTALYFWGGRQWMAISGINFYSYTRDIASGDYTTSENINGLAFFAAAGQTIQGVLIEGCKFRFYKDNTITNQGGNATVDGITIRRSLFLNNYSGTTSHSQGLFVDYSSNILLEENIFDHNGWYYQNDHDGTDELGEATIFNHNTYFSHSTNITFRGNIFMRGSSINNKFRTHETGSGTGISIDNNLYVGGEIAVSLGAWDEDADLRWVSPSITNNVITNIGYSEPVNRGVGWAFDMRDWDGGVVEYNYIINQPLDSVNNVIFWHMYGKSRNVRIENNVVHGVRYCKGFYLRDGGLKKGMTIANNKIQLPVDSNEIIQASEIVDTTGYTFKNNIYYF